MQVLLFGMIAERAGADCIDLNAADTTELRSMLTERINGLESLSYAIAVDRVIINKDMPLTGSEEIAVLPPFAGG
ncbi:MAG: MoaD/ThiS family protein [Flavobacteriales bacterium]|nr:MoaD/ThiS family protein [Flavobacteriales bacterium]